MLFRVGARNRLSLFGVAIPKNIPHTVCVVPRNWTAAQISCRNCSNDSHIHLDRNLIGEAVEFNIIQWITFPRTSRGERGIARWLRQIPVRGMSCRLGMSFAGDIPEWAKVMLSSIRLERESSSNRDMAERVKAFLESDDVAA